MFDAVYHKLSRELEAYFAAGSFRGRLPGVLPLCKRFNTSKKTMSKALHILRKRGVVTIEGTRGMFYNGNIPRYPIRYGVIGICGLIQQEKIIPLLNEKFRHTGFALLGLDIPYSRNPGQLSDWFLHLPVDGIILLNSSSRPALLDFFYENNIPVIGCTLPGYEHISGYEPDHYQTYSKILMYLQRRGHRRIGLVSFQPEKIFRFYFDQIKTAFRDVLLDEYDESLIYAPETLGAYLTHCPMESAFSHFARDAFRHLTTIPEPPTAVVAEQHILFHIRTAAESRGLSIPGDLSLFSIQYYFQRDPFYTTALVRDDVAVGCAVKKMADMLNGKEVVPQHIFVPMTFKQGMSVADLSKKQ